MLTADLQKEKRRQYYEDNKQLVIDRAKEWKKANPNKRRLSNRKSQLKSTYGISWEVYEEMYNKAEGRCQICHTYLELAPDKPGVNKAACVDHCHTTGIIRGILCRSCNVAIGHLQDSKDRAWNAYKYLESYHVDK